MKRAELPSFGNLNGIRVVTTGTNIAGPVAATFLAEQGAEVIHIESTKAPDMLRRMGRAWTMEHRNGRSMALNIPDPEGKKIFLKLLEEADVLIEASKAGQYDKWGLTDEVLWQVNPKLVIVHISGLGNAKFGGVPSVCNRASYDMIGQAFSGWLYLQGFKDRDPVVAKPYMNDFVSAFAALFGTLAAYNVAQKTGKGQVVDVAQFEAMAQYMCGTYTSYTMAGAVTERSGNASPAFQPYDLFESKDGALVALGAFGPGVYKRCIKALGFDLEYFNYKDCSSGVEAVASPKGRELNARVVEWCKAHTAAEIEQIMEDAKVPCSKVNNAKDTFENEHFKSRGDWITYEDQTVGADITAFGIAPKLSETPGKVWRGAPSMGQDTDNILKTILGYDDAKIAELHEKNLI